MQKKETVIEVQILESIGVIFIDLSPGAITSCIRLLVSEIVRGVDIANKRGQLSSSGQHQCQLSLFCKFWILANGPVIRLGGS